MDIIHNRDLILVGHNFTEDQDKEFLVKQLAEAPLFCTINVNDLYKKRIDDFKLFTDGFTVLEAKAVTMEIFFDQFYMFMRKEFDLLRSKCIRNEISRTEYSTSMNFFLDDETMKYGLLENEITESDREKFNIKSPKYSKHLIKSFGEQSAIVKVFNNRPKKEVLLQGEMKFVEKRKLVVSTLAANVMKMTADNYFTSCQDYTSLYDLSELICLPTSIHDENLAIAYIMDEDDENVVTYPKMRERVLLSSFEYNGNPFLLAWNLYTSGSSHCLVSSLKALFGQRILFAGEICNGNRAICVKFEKEYDYDLRFMFNYDGDTYGCYPYVNNGDKIFYDRHDDVFTQTIRLDKNLLDTILNFEGLTGTSDPVEEGSITLITDEVLEESIDWNSKV